MLSAQVFPLRLKILPEMKEVELKPLSTERHYCGDEVKKEWKEMGAFHGFRFTSLHHSRDATVTKSSHRLINL